jgi:hypothetical protein
MNRLRVELAKPEHGPDAATIQMVLDHLRDIASNELPKPAAAV